MIPIKKIQPGKYRTLLFLLIAALLFSACDRSRNDRGYHYFPDMFYSAAYKTYSEHPVLTNEKTMLEPPEGSVPVGFTPFLYDNSFESREKAGKTIKNPYTADKQLIEEGDKLYGIFCKNCHGETGAGDGFLHTSGKYPIKPASLITDVMKQKPSAEIFHVITKGWGVMSAHETLIKPEDRWKIVLFVETLQQKN